MPKSPKRMSRLRQRFVLCSGLRQDERSKRQNAALAPVVRAQNEDQILDGDDDNQGPEDQREHAQYVRMADSKFILAPKRFSKGIERAGSDVAVDDAKRAQRQIEQILSVGTIVSVLIGVCLIPLSILFVLRHDCPIIAL